MELVGAGALQSLKLGAQLWLERYLRGDEHAALGQTEVGKHGVDRVDAGTRHEPDIELVCHGAKFS